MLIVKKKLVGEHGLNEGDDTLVYKKNKKNKKFRTNLLREGTRKHLLLKQFVVQAFGSLYKSSNV